MHSIAYAALWLFVFSVPWEGVIRIGGISIVSRMAGVVALGVTLLAVVIAGRMRRWHVFHIAALLFVLCAGFGLFFFSSTRELPNKFYTYIQLFAVLWMAWELAPSRGALYGLLLAYVMGAYVASVTTVMLYHRQAAVLRRFAVGDVDPNDLAMMLALAVPMAWYLGMVFHRPLLRLVCRAYLPVGLFGLGLTGSRGGMLTAMVALMIVPLSMTKLSPGRLAAAMITLTLSGVLVAVYLPDKVVDRLASTHSSVSSLSLGGRFKLWVAGLEAFVAKPLMGYGTSGFIRAIYPKLGRDSLVAHNSFISLLVEQGLIGFLCYMAMMLVALSTVLRLPRIDRRFGLVLLATLFLAMSPLTWEDRKPVWLVMALLVGLAEASVAMRGGGQGQVPVTGLPVGPPRRVRPPDPAPGPRGRSGATR